MYTPIHLLPQFDTSKKEEYKNRWNDHKGRSLRDKLLKMIRKGAGEDFLQWDFQHGRLGFLENEWDLKGFTFFDEDITFPEEDNFQATDFSYSDFYHSKFKNAYFYCNFNFVKIYNCEFIKCTFHFNHFYASNIEKVKFIHCNFIENNSFTNCNLSLVNFNKCFINKNIFFDCKFDENTNINEPIKKPLEIPNSSLELDNKEITEIYKGIKEAYANGGVIKKSQKYYFKQKHSITRYNTNTFKEKILGYFLENIAGYGVRPLRVFETMLLVFLISFTLFAHKIGFSKGLILTSGAFFTFGANTDFLEYLGISYKLLYVITSFSGISLIALLITVLANLWFSEK